MTQGQPWKKLMIFAVPLLIGNMFQQLYSTVDAIFLGRFVGDNALAAVGSSVPVFFLTLVILMGVGIGAGIMVSQYLGAKNREDISNTIGTSITIVTISSLLIMIFVPFGTRPLLTLLDTPAEILDDSVLYMNILVWGILGMGYFNVLSSIIRGLGDSFSPLLYLICACLLNIALNTVFIVILGWGVFGAAIGTVIAQAFSSILCFRRLFKMREIFDMGWQYFKPKEKYIRQVLKLGLATGASQAAFAVGMMIIQPLVNGFSSLFIATNLIVMRIDGFVMMPIFSFGNAITVFTGQNVGAGKIDRVTHGMKQCCLIAGGTAFVILSLILLFGHHVAGAFTQTQEVVDMSVRMLRILAPGYLALSISMVFWGVIRGAGDAISPLWGAIAIVAVIRVPSAYLLVHYLGVPEALMFSMLLGWLSNLTMAILIFRRGKWREKSLVHS
jgi:putative MATE family efflux protein